jgi:sortase (surface protein transpeptidase)
MRKNASVKLNSILASFLAHIRQPRQIQFDRRRMRFAGLALGLLAGGLIAGTLFAARMEGGAPLGVISVAQLSPPAPAGPPGTPVAAAGTPPSATDPAQTVAVLPPLPPLAPQTANAAALSAANHLIIPKLGIDSGWMPIGYLANGITMDSPPGPEDLGWYTFTALPGTSGNAVFSGHVDWHTGAPALFEHLGNMQVGDEVDISRADGSLARYRVDSSVWYPLYGTAAAPIVAATPTPTLTLITCGGDFDQSTHEYDERLVVRAQSVTP